MSQFMQNTMHLMNRVCALIEEDVVCRLRLYP